MKKVLLISYSFPPANSPAAKRPYYFAKYLGEYNCQAFVLTARNQLSSLGYGSNLTQENFEFVDTPPCFSISQRTSKELVKPGLVTAIFRHLLFPDRGIIWAPNALKKGFQFLKKQKDIDCIFATAPSFANILIALILSFIFQKKLIVDFRDFYFTKGLFKRFILLRWLDYLLEVLAMRRANKIVFVSNGMLNCYVNRYPFIKSKSSIIYNGIDLQTNAATKEVKKFKGNSDVVKLFYAGSLYLNSPHPRNIFVLLDQLEILKSSNSISNYEFHIASNLNAVEVKMFDKYVQSGSVKLLGVLSQQEVETYYQTVNACVLILGDSEQDQYAVPIKVFEYLHTGLPILTLCPANAEIVDILGDAVYNGICYYAEQFKKINQETILSWFEKVKYFQPENSSTVLLSKFNRKEQAQMLSNLIHTL